MTLNAHISFTARRLSRLLAHTSVLRTFDDRLCLAKREKKKKKTQQPAHRNHVFTNDHTDKRPQRANILKEVQIMRQLDHPNIINLIDFSESKQYYYIILELAPGGELFHQIVRLTYFSEDLSRHVILQVAKALEYLHEVRGVVHRSVTF